MQPTQEQIERGRRLIAEYERDHCRRPFTFGQADRLAIGAAAEADGYDGTLQVILWCRAIWLAEKERAETE